MNSVQMRSILDRPVHCTSTTLEVRSFEWVICSYAAGGKLACEGSPMLDELGALEANGVRLVLCNTCLNFYGLSEKVAVGFVGGMGDILSIMWAADKVISI